MKDWYGMTIRRAYMVARPSKVTEIRNLLKDKPQNMRMDHFRRISGSVTHSETIIADIEFNIFGD